MKLTDGEKLILLMLADLQKHLKIKNPEFDSEFIQNTISHNYLWGFDWQYSGIPFEDRETPAEVTETLDYLDMWYLLERSHEDLSPADKEKVKKESRFGHEAKFPGFDGNHEPHFGIAQYLIEQLKRFEHFKGRNLNSHSHQIERYARMYPVFDRIRETLHARLLTADEIIEIMNAGVHPSAA
jgi:uncharacterized protein